MTKTEIAKRLREISDNLLEARLDLRGRSEDKLLELLDASIEAEEAIKDLMLDANAGKMPRKTPVRNKSNQVFYIEKTFGNTGEWSENVDPSWDEKLLKSKLTTAAGWQRIFDHYRNSPEQPIDLKVFDVNKKPIARFRRDLDLAITHNEGR